MSKHSTTLQEELAKLQAIARGPAPEISPATQTRLAQYDKFVAEARVLFATRNTEYGDAIVNWGVLGAVVELTTVAARLRQVMLHPDCVNSEERRMEVLHDKLRDGINFCLIGLMMLEDNNMQGKE